MPEISIKLPEWLQWVIVAATVLAGLAPLATIALAIIAGRTARAASRSADIAVQEFRLSRLPLVRLACEDLTIRRDSVNIPVSVHNAAAIPIVVHGIKTKASPHGASGPTVRIARDPIHLQLDPDESTSIGDLTIECDTSTNAWMPAAVVVEAVVSVVGLPDIRQKWTWSYFVYLDEGGATRGESRYPSVNAVTNTHDNVPSYGQRVCALLSSPW